MLNLFLRKLAIAAGIAAGALCIAYTAFAQVGTANPQGSPSVNNSQTSAANGPTFSSGEYVFKFKGTTTEGLPQYEVFKGDADIGTVTQTVKGYGYKANDQATIKDTKGCANGCD